MSTTTAQGVRCGNHPRTEKVYHATTAAVRACYLGTRPVSAPPAAPSSQPANADEARSASMQRLASQKSPFFQDRNMGRVYPASPKQVNFLEDLIREVMAEELQPAAYAKIEAGISSAEAKTLITAMVELRDAKRQRDAEHQAPTTPKPSGTWKNERISEIMGAREERNFCIIDEDGKARFYRVSKRGKNSRRPGTWKIQERVSDSLFPRADSMLTKVAVEIMAQGGAKAAGQRFAELMHKCYECGASLTDTTGNPYYAFGLGPECGAK